MKPPIYDPEFLELTTGLDVEAFWVEDECCHPDAPLGPRSPLTFSPDDHWLFEFLSVESTLRYYRDKPYRDELHREANRLTRAYVGKTFFDEDTWEHQPQRIEHLFGCFFTYVEGGTPWLTPTTSDPHAFSRLLDEVERIDLHAWAFPEPYLQEWEERKNRGLAIPSLGTGSRGPATIMSSVLHPETLFYWLHDEPALMRRFRDLLALKMIEFNRILREFSGYTQNAWWITDDNSALFNRRLYHEYCAPVLAGVLETFAPDGQPEKPYRYQHSDSAMGHLLDEQRDLGINACNYGPTVDAALIRQHLPEAVIHGQMPPMLLRNGSPEEIRRQVRADFLKAGTHGRMVQTTAGSLAAGTGLGRMRWMMRCVQEETRLA